MRTVPITIVNSRQCHGHSNGSTTQTGKLESPSQGDRVRRLQPIDVGDEHARKGVLDQALVPSNPRGKYVLSVITQKGPLKQPAKTTSSPGQLPDLLPTRGRS